VNVVTAADFESAASNGSGAGRSGLLSDVDGLDVDSAETESGVPADRARSRAANLRLRSKELIRELTAYLPPPESSSSVQRELARAHDELAGVASAREASDAVLRQQQAYTLWLSRTLREALAQQAHMAEQIASLTRMLTETETELAHSNRELRELNRELQERVVPDG
jgi:chromosome segregation ATPase